MTAEITIPKAKHLAMQREIGRLKRRVSELQTSVEHYRGLVGERDQALHTLQRQQPRAVRHVTVCSTCAGGD